MAAALDALGPHGDCYDRYVSRVGETLVDDPAVREARESWTAFVRATRGDVFEQSGVDPGTAFADACYYDFVVDCAIGAVERDRAIRLANPGAEWSGDPAPPDLGRVHDRVARSRDRRAVADALGDLPGGGQRPGGGARFLRSLHGAVVSRSLRRVLGDYYTPRGVAALAVDALDADAARASFLDPGCGSGVFLAVCAERKRRALDGDDPAATLRAVTRGVRGLDVDPVAVRAAKLAYLLAVSPLLTAGEVERVAVPVFLGDALGLAAEPSPTLGGEPVELSADHLVGNPPWVTWDRLPGRLRERWHDAYPGLDLVPATGAAGRLGHANDDVAIPYAWVCLHRYLARGGRASFVLKRDVATGRAGSVLRSLSVGGRPLRLVHVHDFGELRPFGAGADAATAVYTVAADAEPSFPAPVTAWRRSGTDRPAFATRRRVGETLAADRTGLVPIEAGDPSSPWVRVDAERAALGDCDHEIRHGLKDDAKAVFSLDRGDLADVEPDHVYPYVASRHVTKYGLLGHDRHLVPQRVAGEDNEATLREECPATYDYLRANRERLERRSSSWFDRGPFYSLFGLGEYTWSDYKLAWCRLGFKPDFAVVSTVEDPVLGEKPVVPGDHYMFVPTGDEREAHFLCALCNAAPYQRTLRDVTSRGKSTLSKSAVSRLRLPAWPGTETAARLADLSMTAHEVVAERVAAGDPPTDPATDPDLAPVQAEIDRLVESWLTD